MTIMGIQPMLTWCYYSNFKIYTYIGVLGEMLSYLLQYYLFKEHNSVRC